jgi:hypothetical protein
LEVVVWTRLLCGTIWLMTASHLGCASTPKVPPAAKPPEYFRSPPLDYVEPLRSADDGEVMGAQEQPIDDWVRGNATHLRPAPGWGLRYGGVYFERARARAGYGTVVESPGCYPPLGGAPALELADTRPMHAERAEGSKALAQAWEDVAPEPYVVNMASIAAELRKERSHWLVCDRQ